MMHLEGLSKSFGSRALFDGLVWHLPVGERVGLVGPNGAGKSTLIKIIAGVEVADGGRVTKPSAWTVGYLPQEIGHVEAHSVLDEVISGQAELLGLEAEMESLRVAMESERDPDAQEKLSARYGQALSRYEMLDGYTLRARARSILSGMGFDDARMDEPLTTFSGGWQMRALLSKLLLERPDVLLMDEPTNHLDLPSVEWLEGFLRGYPGSVIIISHDRYFLNRMVTQIAELSQGRLDLYKGDYDAYLIEREQRREVLLKAAEQQSKEIAKMEAFVERFRAKATKAKQAQSRLKALEKIERIDVGPGDAKTMRFTFPQPERSGNVVLEVEGVRKAYGEHVVYESVDLKLTRGERVALVGPNGAGKTTLLKVVAGATEIQAGSVELGHNVSVQYFAQHQVDALDMGATVLENMERSATYDSIGQVRGILGAFLFSGDDVHKKVSVLSGGEKNRVAMAQLLLRPANLLLLDEPTNHLDIASRQMLEEALSGFQGTICFVSHDRHFINAVATRVIHVDGGGLVSYEGNYEYYHWKRTEEAAAATAAASSSEVQHGGSPGSGGSSQAPGQALTRRDAKRIRAELRNAKGQETKSLRRSLEGAEADVERLEGERDGIDAQMQLPETYDDGAKVAALAARRSAVESELAEAYGRWEELSLELEEIEEQYREREREALGSWADDA